MNPLGCQDVVERIELYVAGECSEPERSAIRQHLTHCSTCARTEQQARLLLGLLALRLQEPERLGRLQARLRSEERCPRQVKILAFARRAAALAAMLLLAVGLSLWFRNQGPLGSQNPLVVAWGPPEMVRTKGPAGLEHQPAIAALKAKETTRGYALDLGGMTAARFRQEIKASKDRLPAPPLVNLELELRNATEGELKIHVGAEGSELQLELKGPGAVSAQGKFAADFLVAKTIRLGPGRSYRLPITRLVYGSRDKIQAAYWTKVGEYTMTLRYKVAVSPPPHGTPRAILPGGEKVGFVTLQSPLLKIRVK